MGAQVTSPAKVQMNVRVTPEVRLACARAARDAGLSLNLWAAGILEEASRPHRPPSEPIPGQTTIPVTENP